MDNQNICKFVTYQNTEKITTTNFVLECNTSYEKKMHLRKNHMMCLVTGGTGRFCCELYEKELKKGDMFFLFSGSISGILNTGNLQYMYVSFSGLRSDELFRRFGISPGCSVFTDYQELIPFWQNCLSKANEKNLDLISESVLMYSFSQMSAEKNDSEHHLIGDILKHVEDHFSDFGISLSKTAQVLGYNEKYVSRVFKKSMGMSFSEYLKNVRLQHSIFLIDQGITAVKNIAFLCGYQDPLYFSNVFKKAVGTSPSDFISRRKNEETEKLN